MTIGYPELLLAFGLGFGSGGVLVNHLWMRWAKKHSPRKQIAR